jgi:hypothetical protein
VGYRTGRADIAAVRYHAVPALMTKADIESNISG